MKNKLVNSGNTIIRLIGIDILTNWQFIIISLASVIGLLVIINVSSVVSHKNWDIHMVFFPITLMVGGMVLTSICFNELHQKNKSYAYLLLPGNTLEKVAARLVLTTIGFVIVAVTGYFLHSLIAAGITTFFLKMAHPIFNPFKQFYLWFIHLYIATQSVIFFGALYFRRLTLLKSIFSIVVLATVLIIYTLILVRIIFFNNFSGFFTPIEDISPCSTSQEYVITAVKFLLQVIQVILYWLLAPFFWILSFFRLRETEV